MTHRRTLLLFGLLVLAASCGSDAPTLSAERQIVSVGVVGALDIEPGVSILRGVQIAIGEYNAAPGSTFEARLVRVATEGTAEGLDKASQRLVETERIIGVITALSEGDIAKIGSGLNEALIPFIVPNLQSIGIPLDGWTSFRRLIVNDRQEGSQLAAELARRTEGSAFVVHTTDVAGSASAEGAKSQFESLTRQIIKVEQLNAKTDLGAVSTAIVQSGAQMVVFAGDGQVGRPFGAALKKSGYKGSVAFTHQVMGVESSAPAVPERSISSSATADKADRALEEFQEIHSRRFSEDAGPSSLESYEGTMMLLEAIQEVEARPREITEFLRLNRKFRGDSKEYAFDDKGDLSAPTIWLFESGSTWRFTGRSSQPIRNS